MTLILLLAMAVAGMDAPRTPPQDKKVPIPDGAAQKEAERLIRDIFKDDYAKKTLPDRISLAKKLFDQASESKDDPASRYVLLREARDLAGQAGEADLALSAIDRIATHFEGDILPMKGTVLATLGKMARSTDELQKLARACLALVDDAVAAEQFDVAEKAADQASGLAKRAKDVPLSTKADSRARQLSDWKSRFEKVRKARETLQAKPSDPAANLTVGYYEGPVRGNWDVALRHLVQGSDPALKLAAEKDLGPPAGASEEVSTADGWWTLAEKEKDPILKEGFLKRARFWYRQAVPGLTGLAKARVEKRVGDPLLEQFGGTWVDVSDPKGYGQQTKPGEPLHLIPRTGSLIMATLDKMPAGEFDAVTVRVRHAPGTDGLGQVFYEGDSISGCFDKSARIYVTLKMAPDGSSWIRESEVQADPRDEYTITVINSGGEYIHYLDGKEMARQKAKTSKVLRVAFQAQLGAVTFDQIRLRRKE
jgi:hypothetical protein